MRISSLLMTGAVASVAVASPAMAQSQSFGTLSYPSSGGGSIEIPYLWSDNVNDNTNFLYTNQTVNGKSLTVGLRASPYYTGDNGLPSYVGSNTFQVQAGTTVPVANAGQYFDPNAPRWGFNWSISMDGDRSDSALSNLWWSMRITGPNSSGGTGNWGTQLGGMVNLGGGATGSPATNYSKASWQLGYNFFPLSSQNTPGVNQNGLWDGLQFNPNVQGNYQFTIDIRQGQTPYGTVVGSTTMTVSVIPAPGALALLGAAGLFGARRRRD